MRFIVAVGLFALSAFAQDVSGVGESNEAGSDLAISDPDATGSGDDARTGDDTGSADDTDSGDDVDDYLYYPCYPETGYGVPYCCDDGAATEPGCEELDLDDEEIFSFEEFVGYCNTLSRPSCCTGEEGGDCIGATIY